MIGYACCLLATDMELIVVETDFEAQDTLDMYDACESKPRIAKTINALIERWWKPPEGFNQVSVEGGEHQVPEGGTWKSKWVQAAYSAPGAMTTMNREDFKLVVTRNRLRAQLETPQHYFLEGIEFCPQLTCP